MALLKEQRIQNNAISHLKSGKHSAEENNNTKMKIVNLFHRMKMQFTQCFVYLKKNLCISLKNRLVYQCI